jgi:hypothetical protein
MKYIKSFKFKSFESSESTMTKTFSQDQYDEFCEFVAEWQEKHQKPVLWSIYVHPYERHPIWNTYARKDSIRLWNIYVKSPFVMTLIDLGDELIAVAHKGDHIKIACKSNDEEVDKSMVMDFIKKNIIQ